MLLNLIEAINQALTYSLTQDPKVVLLGEDIGKNGGVFRATVGLYDSFPGRVFDTPLAENMLAGMAVGMAACGLRPVIEIQFMGFLYAALDQLISHAARMRFRTRGRLACPLVMRVPYGCGIHAPEHHSESTEALLTQIPGIRVVVPSSPSKAYGLLLAAILDPDPVIFLEPTRIYRLFKQEVAVTGQALPLDRSFILKEGQDLSLISWGAMLQETLVVAENLAAKGVSAEVVDVATLKPLDLATILGSVNKTGRCVIIHEAPKTGGVGAEIAARVAEESLGNLLAPIKRVAGLDTVVPPYRAEKFYMPSVKKIMAAVEVVLSY